MTRKHPLKPKPPAMTRKRPLKPKPPAAPEPVDDARVDSIFDPEQIKCALLKLVFDGACTDTHRLALSFDETGTAYLSLVRLGTLAPGE